MAVINFYDDILGSVKETKEVNGGSTLRKYIEDYFADKGEDYEVVESYNLETGETEYKTIQIEHYKVLTLVNEEEKELDSVVQNGDVVQVVFIPESSDWSTPLTAIGGIVTIFGGVVSLFQPWIGGALIAVGSMLTLIGGSLADNSSSKGESQALDTESALSLQGGSNQSLVGNRYPFIMGKHLINPYVVGSPYNTTHCEDMTGKDSGQYLSGLYCIGYAPLKITDIKIGEVMAAYNREVNSNGVKTVMHGRLKKFVNSEADNGEILRKWKNNDLSFEILQKGKLALDENKTEAAQMTDMYGSIYPQKVAQLEVDANLLNIKDGLISSTATRVYKGVSVPNGFMSNSVRFSENCPNRLEVELDFPNGLYANRSKGSNIWYYNLPVRLAVQWRFVKDGQNSSDALDPNGWNNFDYILTDEDDCKTKNVPKTYTLAKKLFDYNSAYGKTDYFDETDPDSLDDFIFNDNWIQEGVKLFEFGCDNEPDNIKNAKTYTGRNYAVTDFISEQAVINAGNYYLDSDLTDLFDNSKKGKYKIRYFARIDAWSWQSATFYNDGTYKLGSKVTTIQSDIEISQSTYEDFLNTYSTGSAGENDYFALDVNSNNKTAYIPNEIISCDGIDEETSTPSGVLAEGEDVRFNIRSIYIQFYTDTATVIPLYKKWTDFNSDINNATGELVFPYGYCYYIMEEYVSCDDSQEIGWKVGSTTTRGWVQLTDEELKEWQTKNGDNLETSEKNPDSTKFTGITIERDGTKYAITKIKHLTVENAARVTALANDINNYAGGSDLTCKRFKPTDFKSASGVHERRYVVVKDFTEAECRQMINFDSNSEVSLNSVEVRVLRITPSYFEEIQDSTSSDDYSAMTYQDLAKWTYLRSFCFDKDEYLTALKTAKANSTLDSVSVTDYPQRPQSQADMDKFCYLAINLKQDVAETGGSSLNAISCIAQSFAPKYNEDLEGTELKKWRPSPNEIKAKYKYFLITTDVDGEKSYQEVTEEEYNNASDKSAYKKTLIGNNYADYIKSYKIFNDDDNAPQLYYTQQPYNSDTYSNEEEQVYPEPFAKYFLSEYTENHYISNNTASIFALALVGPQLGKEAKTFRDINLYSLTEAYKFCDDLTDGTPDETSEDGLKHFKLACNGIVSSEVKLETLCENILTTGRCSLKRDDENKYEVVIGRAQDYPVMLLNQKNCLSKTNTRSFNDIPSGYQISFVDESDNYSTNDIYVMNDGEDYKNPSDEVESLSLQYVTNREQIWTLGRFNLGCRIYQRETYTRKVGKAGYLLSFGDMVLLQDETLVVGTDKGARIKQIIYDDNNDINGKNHKYIYGFITDEPFECTGKTKNGVNVQGVTVMQASKTGRSRCVTLRLAKAGYSFTNDSGLFVMNKGITNIILLKNRIALSEEYIEDELDRGTDAETSDYVNIQFKINDIVAFGLVEDITIKAIVTSIKPSEKEQFDLTLVPYNEKLYKLGKKMVEFKSHMTQPVRELTNAEFVDTPTQADVNTTVATQTSYLNAQVKEITQKLDNTTETPEITVTPTSIGIAVNDESITTKDQTFEITFSIAQFGDELGFTFQTSDFEYNENNETNSDGSIKYNVLPESSDTDSPITYKVDDKKVIITIKKGTKIVTDNFLLPIYYRPLLISTAYSCNPDVQSVIDREFANIEKLNITDEEKETRKKSVLEAYGGTTIYGNGKDEVVYGTRKLSDITDTHVATISAIAVEGGRYLGTVIEVAEDYIYTASRVNDEYEKDGTISVASLVMGDYMTFVGTNKTASEFVAENGNDTDSGQYFFKSRQYEFIGVPDSGDKIMWEWSSISEHISGNLSDALAACNTGLEDNNSQVVEFLDHLTANSIFVNKLVANEAFINSLAANKIVVGAINKNANRVTDTKTCYYLVTTTEATTPTAPSSPDSTTTISNDSLSAEGWSYVYPTISTDDGVMNYVYTCQENTKVKDGTESKEYSAVERDYAAEKINAATQGITLIEGGCIKTKLIKVNEIFAKKIKLQDIKDENGNTTYGSIYGGERYDENGKDNDTTAKGFYLGSDGTLRAKDGYFEGEINATKGTMTDIKAVNCQVSGVFYSPSITIYQSFEYSKSTNTLKADTESFFEKLKEQCSFLDFTKSTPYIKADILLRATVIDRKIIYILGNGFSVISNAYSLVFQCTNMRAINQNNTDLISLGTLEIQSGGTIKFSSSNTYLFAYASAESPQMYFEAVNIRINI